MDGANQCDGGSDEESSSSSYPFRIIDDAEADDADNDEPARLEIELKAFRQNWEKELRRSKSPTGSSGDDGKRPETVEEKARRHFMKGVKEEQGGDLQNAVHFYRLAIQLVPDIEQRIQEEQYGNDESTTNRVRQESESSVDSNPDTLMPSTDTDDEDNWDIEDLPWRFHRLKVTQDAVCHPQYDQAEMHISDMPRELLVYIFKWVVSVDLDLKALEILTQVCRGFYLLGRDEELWRLSCTRVWGRKCGRPTQFGSWRKMFIDRPHPLLGGCYISRMSYVRHGEKGLDNFYKPFFLVEYYRYFRFYSDGTLVMVTSTQDPNVIVSHLRLPRPVLQGLFYGRYQIVGNQITAVMKRQLIQNNPRSRRTQPENEQTFYIDLMICGKRHQRLKWQHFAVHTLKRSSNFTNMAEFELTEKGYPPLQFARVKSYSAVSENPLA